MDAEPKLKGYILVAAVTVFFYDFLCTFPQEVAYVWSRPWSIGTVLFFLNRYLPFVDITLSLRLLTTISTPERCFRRFMIIAWFLAIGMAISQLILLIRTYAMWHLKRSITIFLFCLAFITIIPGLVFAHMEAVSLEFRPVEGHRYGCNIVRARNIGIIAYIALFISETTIVILTMIKASQHLRHSSSSSSWVFQLYRDGIIFYFYLLAMTIANAIVPVLADFQYKGILASPQRVLHSVLCTRVILVILRQRSDIAQRNTTNSYSMSRNSQQPRTEILTTIIDTRIDADIDDSGEDLSRSIGRDWTS
ncbi:hypothetical protein BDZ94DRAFT_1327133 [Collybia nuda]|uniref:DUF6533 domain-containing protein n=1 Tax=Collybia nuda TaxID=64659 RepID=A0A9P5XR86_9AGAR|nr:hypothetical protein BDZ94DRAFT_1327133 [Collybia nuda]